MCLTLNSLVVAEHEHEHKRFSHTLDFNGHSLRGNLSSEHCRSKNRRGKGAYLCDDCRFNDSEKCLKPVRPYAVECTSYRPNLKQS